jgi:hypothetical protein
MIPSHCIMIFCTLADIIDSMSWVDLCNFNTDSVETYGMVWIGYKSSKTDKHVQMTLTTLLSSICKAGHAFLRIHRRRQAKKAAAPYSTRAYS